MSTQVLPSLPGLGWDVIRTPMWRNTIQDAYSGAETAVAYWSYPKWKWQLNYNVLRQGAIGAGAFTEMTQLLGFFNKMMGRFDSWLYQDADDNTATGQGIGTGNGSATDFLLVRDYGGFVEPIFAPNVVSAVYANGVLVNPATYTVNAWDSPKPGYITFNTPPANAAVITADFTFYFPCRFLSDEMDFTKFMKALFSNKGVEFTSIKLGA